MSPEWKGRERAASERAWRTERNVFAYARVNPASYGGTRFAREPVGSLRAKPSDQYLAGPTGLEPATSGVTGQRSNQLNYDPANRTSNFKVRTSKAPVRTAATHPFELRSSNFRAGLPSQKLAASAWRRLSLPSRSCERSERSAKAGGRYRIRTCDSRRVRPVLYH